MSDLQRDIDVMDSLVRQLNGWGLSSEESCAWQRIRARLTPDREREAMAIGGAIKDHFSDKPWTEVRLIAADAAIDAQVPDGYALVPVEPTREMRRAAIGEYEDAVDARLPDGDGYDEEVVTRLYRAMLAAIPAQQPAAAVPAGWRVMWFTGSFKRGSERWEIYDPEGNGGAVAKGDIRDDMVWGLLDALAAANKENKND